MDLALQGRRAVLVEAGNQHGPSRFRRQLGKTSDSKGIQDVFDKTLRPALVAAAMTEFWDPLVALRDGKVVAKRLPPIDRHS